MAFYADVYGYISVQKGQQFLPKAPDNGSSSGTFHPCFATKVDGRIFDLIPFACNVKLDEGEDSLWLSPFEDILRNVDFVSAVVNVMHEESNHIMMYSYVKDGQIKKFTSRQTEEFIDEAIIF